MISYPRTVRALQPVIGPLLDALSEGLDVASEIHTSRRWHRERDKQYFSHTVRREAVERLEKLGFLAQADDSSRPAVAMSGIMILHEGVALRVYRPPLTRRKVVQVPLPGRSRRLQEFWRQGSVLPGMETNNVLALWQDEGTQLVEPLLLVRPLGGDHRRRNLEVHWQGKLSREMASMRAEDLDMLRPDFQSRHLGHEDAG